MLHGYITPWLAVELGEGAQRLSEVERHEDARSRMRLPQASAVRSAVR